ncbi:MAG: enoyl-CoA hydratase [Desulfobacteraceae bacterium]|nr:enoyl-CoA hydratase/isomerase family protein [Desulfobacteraceae bacterium]MBC2757307.1 enoyl-CoA hydratase [Desulfobacteraceae bacterium]
MDVKTFEEIVYDKDEKTGIVTVAINNPKIKNALTLGVCLELYWAVDAMQKDDTARAMILTGTKPEDTDDPTKEAFCSGGYFNPSYLQTLDEEKKKQIDFSDIAQKKLCLKMWEFDKPVIAAINGLAIGGGFTIPLACADLIFMSEHAWVRLPFVSLGIIPELASSYLLPRLIGFQRAKEIMFFGETLPAQQLFDLGIVNKVLPHDQLLPHARETALRLIPPAGAGLSVRLTKQALHRPLIRAVTEALDRENEYLNKAFSTTDFFEALTARREKRAPVFKGE